MSKEWDITLTTTMVRLSIQGEGLLLNWLGRVISCDNLPGPERIEPLINLK
jgi:hypothetical protein